MFKIPGRFAESPPTPTERTWKRGAHLPPARPPIGCGRSADPSASWENINEAFGRDGLPAAEPRTGGSFFFASTHGTSEQNRRRPGFGGGASAAVYARADVFSRRCSSAVAHFEGSPQPLILLFLLLFFASLRSNKRQLRCVRSYSLLRLPRHSCLSFLPAASKTHPSPTPRWLVFFTTLSQVEAEREARPRVVNYKSS